jgi:hypothetical protein
LADEHGAALGVGMKRDCGYAAPIFGIQLTDGPNQANGGLTAVDHCNSTWKPDILERVGLKHPDSLWSAAMTEHRIDTCALLAGCDDRPGATRRVDPRRFA